jgi:hypothetical protein
LKLDSTPFFPLPRTLRALAFLAALLPFLAGCATLSPTRPEKVVVPPEAVKPAEPAAPPPSVDLSLYRSGRMDPRLKLVNASLQNVAFKNPAAGLKGLTESLTAGEKDPFLKVKRIHDWICLHIDYDAAMLKRGQVVDQDLESVLKSGKAVCSGYANLFQAMAEYAGIQTVTVSGFVKNQAGSRGMTAANSHAWNLVRLAGRWYIVDATFDAGYVQDWLFVREYTTDNLFADPAASIFTRFPKEEGSQLLARPVSAQAFLDSPDVEGAFYDYGLKLPASGLSWKNRSPDPFALDLESASPGLMLDAAVFAPDGREIEGYSLVQRPSATTRRILIHPSEKGFCRVEIYTKSPEEKGFRYLIPTQEFERKILPALKKLKDEGKVSASDLTMFAAAFGKIPSGGSYMFREDALDPARTAKVASLLEDGGGSTGTLQKVLTFLIEGTASPLRRPFPRIYAQYQNSSSDSLVEPLSGELQAGQTIRFTYLSPTSAKAALIVGEKFYEMAKGADGSFSLELQIPKTDSLKLGLSSGGSSYSIAVAWTVL